MHEQGDDPDDLSPLVDRLRTMEWPEAPADARERCLREILRRVGPEGTPDAPPDSA